MLNWEISFKHTNFTWRIIRHRHNTEINAVGTRFLLQPWNRNGVGVEGLDVTLVGSRVGKSCSLSQCFFFFFKKEKINREEIVWLEWEGPLICWPNLIEINNNGYVFVCRGARIAYNSVHKIFLLKINFQIIILYEKKMS